MKKVLILGAHGKIARLVEQMIIDRTDLQITLLLRNARRLQQYEHLANVTIVEGDVSDRQLLDTVMENQEVVYANLNGDMEQLAHDVISSMTVNEVKQLIWITGSGLYHEVPDPFGSWVENYVGHESKENTRRAAKLIEASSLDYTIIRAAYMTNDDEIDYQLTKKGEMFKGTMISRKSIADLVVKIINDPSKYNRESYGISKPGTDKMLNEIRKIEHDL